MFENYREMSDAEKASVKAVHKALRAQTGSRAGNLAWGFVRGLPYKRIERSVREHNHPNARYMTYILAKAIPGFAEIPKGPAGERWWEVTPSPEVEAWLQNPEGAIPAPPPRPKLTPEEARALHESRKVA